MTFHTWFTFAPYDDDEDNPDSNSPETEAAWNKFLDDEGVPEVIDLWDPDWGKK